MSDRIFAFVVIVVALAYIASATQIQTSFLVDPVGPKTFPLIIGGVAVIAALVVALRPEGDPKWPGFIVFIKLGVALAVLVAYAYALRPMGFIIPTALAAGALSFQIEAKIKQAALTGLGLSIGLFLIFKYALDLGLFAFPKSWFG